MQLESDMFPNVKWNDEEPTEVELIVHNNEGRKNNRWTLREFIELSLKTEDEED